MPIVLVSHTSSYLAKASGSEWNRQRGFCCLWTSWNSAVWICSIRISNIHEGNFQIISPFTTSILCSFL